MRLSLKVFLFSLVLVMVCFFIVPAALADDGSSADANLPTSNSQEAPISIENQMIIPAPEATIETEAEGNLNNLPTEEGAAVEEENPTSEELTLSTEPTSNNQDNPLSAALIDPTFPVGSYVIPMDGKQNDKIMAFGLVYSILGNDTYVYRLIEPPDVTLKTTTYPSGSVYQGGPFLIMPSEASIVNAVRASFPTVTVDTLTESITSTRVILATRQTRILLIYGEYGETGETITNMGLSLTVVTTDTVEDNPQILFSYDVVIDDCPGWVLIAGSDIANNEEIHHQVEVYTSPIPLNVAEAMRAYVAGGGEMIFTDIALADLEQVFPGTGTGALNENGNWEFTYHNNGDFLSQYSGPTTVSMYTMGGGIVVTAVGPGVKILMDSYNYGASPSYRIGAFYFTYGNGIVEGFAFHPGDQQNVYATAIASILLGNKLIHTVSTLETPSEEATLEELPYTGQSDPLLSLGILLILFGLGIRLASNSNFT